MCACLCLGEDYNSEDQSIVIGSAGFTGFGVAPGDLGTEDGCIIVNTVTDKAIEGDETLHVIGEVLANAELAVFAESDSVAIVISENSG